MIIVYTLFADKKEAEKIGRRLLENKLAACVNIWPVESCYWWGGKIAKAKEYACFIKTSKKNFSRVEKFIKKHHSYQVPCIVEIRPSSINKSYLSYLSQNIK